DHGRGGEPGDDPVPRGKAPRSGLDSRRVFRDGKTLHADSLRKLAMSRRVVPLDSAAEDGDRDRARLEGAPVRLAVDAPRQAADDDEARAAELSPNPAGHVGGV